MGNWYIVIPEYTKNLITNPSFELATTGWTAGAGTLTQSSTHQRRGLYSGKYVPSSGTTDGIYFGLTLATTTDYTFSVDVWAADGVSYQIYAYDVTAGSTLGSATTFTGKDSWTRQAVSFTTGANASIRLYVAKNSDASTAAYWVDGAQCEAKAYATTYCDGDRDGCVWTAGAHTSSSERSAQYYGGGQVVDLEEIGLVSGQSRGFKVLEARGVGMPPVQQISQRPALGDGGIFQRAYRDIRVVQLTGVFKGTSLQNLPLHRQQVINQFRLDRLASQQPVQLRYAGYYKPVAIDVYYDAGLDFTMASSGYVERTTLSFVAYDPDWRTVIGTGGADSADNGSTSGTDSGGDTAIDGSAEESIASVNYIIQRDSTGQWATMGTGLAMPSPTGLSATVNALAIGVDGKIYAADTDTNSSVYEWDGTSWTNIGSSSGSLGGFANFINAIVVDADGDLYVGGSFTSIDAVSANGLAKYTRSTDTWSAIGTGANDAVWSLAMDSTGLLYIGGYFTTIDSTAALRIASYDPDTTTVSALDSGANGAVLSIAIDANDDVYAGGAYSAIGTTPSVADRFAQWDGAAWSDVGANFNGNVLGVFVAGDGTVYVAGAFTTAGASLTVNYITAYDPTGATWAALGSGLNNQGNDVVALGDSVFVGGDFTQAGGETVAYSAVYSLSAGTWSALGTDLDNYANVIVAGPDGKLYAGGNFTNVVMIWTGADWQDIVPFTRALIQAADGSIYAGGGFINAGGEANADKIGQWLPDSAAWGALGTGANGTVYAIAEAANGDIYIGGSFSQVGGISNTTGVAYWDGSSWNAMSTGIDGTVLALTFAPNGHLCIGGLFADAGGVSNTKNLAVWTGSAFTAISTGANGAVNAIIYDKAGNIVFGGAFTELGGVSCNYIGQWNGSAFTAFSTGADGYVNALAVLESGDIILAGAFYSAGGTTAPYIARWNGSGFAGLGSGLNNVAYVLALDSNQKIYVGGAFTTAGGVSLPDKAAIYDGSSWSALPVNLPGDAVVEAIAITPTEEVYLGFDTTGTATAAAIN